MTANLNSKQPKLTQLCFLKYFLCFLFEKAECAGATYCMALFLDVSYTVIKIWSYFKLKAESHISHVALGRSGCLWDQFNDG